MKSHNNILIVFLLNIIFCIIEFFGGLFTNSISIISDSIHDFGDALSIGISYILEKVSKRKPDNIYTFGYMRYSILGAIITNTILIIGSILIIINAIKRIINPVVINYDGMLIISIIGIVINFIAAYFTKEGHNHNERSINLHMLEDVFGWIIVFIGSIFIKYTNLFIIDSILSIFLGLFILYHAVNNYKEIVDIFLEKMPNDINIEEIKKEILKIDNVLDIHHIHIWTIDGINNYLTMHVVIGSNNYKEIKKDIKNKLKEKNISHVTLEIEDKLDNCDDTNCNIENNNHNHKHNHNHHHH